MWKPADAANVWPTVGSMLKKILTTSSMTLRLKTIRRSRKPEKKYDAVFERNGREKTVSFGAAGMSDYTKHKNATRKQRYLKRHTGKGEDWRKPDTAGALSRWILWNKLSFRESVADYKRRFGL
jgi:hypothetical protein